MATDTEIAQSDPEYVALKALAQLMARAEQPATPLDALQEVADLARELTSAKYAALAVSDERGRTEGFVTSGLSPEELRGLKTPPLGHGPLGPLRRNRTPIRLNNIQDHPKAFGFPPRHPVMKTLCGVPIVVNDRARGSLYVTDRNGGEPFTDADEVILLTLARHAAQIILQDWY